VPPTELRLSIRVALGYRLVITCLQCALQGSIGIWCSTLVRGANGVLTPSDPLPGAIALSANRKPC